MTVGASANGSGHAGDTSLRGRETECAQLGQMLAAARSGESRVLVLRGDAGVGKSALLDYTVNSASGMRMVHALGVESEMELAFAALHQLCAPLLDRLTDIPAPQRTALETVLGIRAGVPPDRFLVGLAVLSLLSHVSEERPLLCVVDDAQWLDRASAQVLGFVARRLLAESILLVFGARQPGQDLLGLPELEVFGLRDVDARALLDSATHSRLDRRIRDRIVTETKGNPLALLELPRGLTMAQMADGFGLLRSDMLPGRIEQSFMARIEALPAETRQLLLVAAAEPVGDPALVWRAAERLGVAADTAGAGGADGLLSVDERVTFRHPLVRSAVYRGANPMIAGRRIWRWRRSPMGAWTRTVEPGIWHLPPPGRTRPSPPNWSDRPSVHGHAVGWPRWLPSFSGRWPLPPTPDGSRTERWRRRVRASRPVISMPRKGSRMLPIGTRRTIPRAREPFSCGARSRSHQVSAVMLRRCCCERRHASSRSTWNWPGRRT